MLAVGEFDSAGLGIEQYTKQREDVRGYSMTDEICDTGKSRRQPAAKRGGGKQGNPYGRLDTCLANKGASLACVGGCCLRCFLHINSYAPVMPKDNHGATF